MSGKRPKVKEGECCLRPDHPKVGDWVYVVRHEHGYDGDGRVKGRVTSVSHHANKIGVSYVVYGDDGIPYVCPHRGDVSLDHWRKK